MNPRKGILNLLLLLACVSGHHAVAYDTSMAEVIYCDDCSGSKQSLLIDNYVQTTRHLGTLLFIDAELAVATEVYLRPAGSYDPYGQIKYLVESYSNKPYLLTIDDALSELKEIDATLARSGQIGIAIAGDSGYLTAANALIAISDFQSVLQFMLNNGQHPEYSEVIRRAQNQIENINTGISGSLGPISVTLGELIKDSSWIVTFSDGSRVTVNLGFTLVDGKITAVVKADASTAYTATGQRIPLHSQSAAGFGFSGDFVHLLTYGDYMNLIGIGGSMTYRDGMMTCVVGKVEESPGRYIFNYKCE